MATTLDELLALSLEQLEQATDLTALDQVRVRYLGKKGEFTQQMKELGKLDPAQRPIVGQAINQAKSSFQQQILQKYLLKFHHIVQ